MSDDEGVVVRKKKKNNNAVKTRPRPLVRQQVGALTA
jgi:hypothetical protein